MKELQKILPSLASVVLVLAMTVALRFTVFAADDNTNWYDDDCSVTTSTVETFLK